MPLEGWSSPVAPPITFHKSWHPPSIGCGSGLSGKGLEEFRQAGQIARRVREKASALVREGVRVLELCEEVEEAIRSEGAEPAFPCNVGINEVAAHYTSLPGDELRIPPRSIVKIDLGVCLNGYIADTAVTVALAPDLEPLAEASRTVSYTHLTLPTN